MRKSVFLLVAFFTFQICVSQTADIEVSYDYAHRNSSGRETVNTMLLVANGGESKFYSPLSEQIDSLTSTPEGKAAYRQIVRGAMGKSDLMNLPLKKEAMYVVKSRKENTLSFYDLVGSDYWTYTEPLEPQEWTIADSTSNILGYECVLATCTFRGREWNAWFAPSIPISDGPWKLNGLPGLILSASDGSGQYGFVATGIERSESEISDIYGKENYRRIDRIDYLKTKRAYTDNPFSYMLVGSGAVVRNAPAVDNQSGYDFLETDYHK